MIPFTSVLLTIMSSSLNVLSIAVGRIAGSFSHNLPTDCVLHSSAMNEQSLFHEEIWNNQKVCHCGAKSRAGRKQSKNYLMCKGKFESRSIHSHFSLVWSAVVGVFQPASINENNGCFANSHFVKYLVPAIYRAFSVQYRLRILVIPPFRNDITKRIEQYGIAVFEMRSKSGHLVTPYPLVVSVAAFLPAIRPCTAHLAGPCKLNPPADSPPQ